LTTAHNTIHNMFHYLDYGIIAVFVIF